MKVRHIRSLDIWVMTRGNRVLYKGTVNPWHSERVLKHAIRKAA